MSDPQAPDHLARVIAGAAGRGATKLARRVPIAGVPLELVDEEAVGNALGDVAVFVMQRAKHRDEAELVLDPIESLTPIFVRALRELAQERPVALFFDTFEETRHIVEPWLQRLLRGEYGAIPSQFLCSIAGRHPLASEAWGSYASLVHQIELGPLSEGEAAEFLRKKGVTNPDLITEIIRLSHRLPILLVSMTIGTPKAIRSDTAVELVLRSVPDDYRSVALNAAAPRTLDRDVAKVAIGESGPDDAFDWLVDMPFVLDSTDGWKYHQVIREEFLQYSARESASDLAALHGQLAEYHNDRREQCFDADDFSQGFNHAAEVAYHRVAGGEKDALTKANMTCLALWAQTPHATRIWAQALRDGERDLVKGDGKGWGTAWIEAVDEYFRGHEQPAIELLGRLLDTADLAEEDRILALTLRCDLFYGQERQDAALRDIDEAIALRQSDPLLYYERAWVHLRCDRFDSAFEDAERALILAGEEDEPKSKYCDLFARAAFRLLEPDGFLEVLDGFSDRADESWALRIRGRALRELNRTDEALATFERILEKSDSHGHAACEQLGVTYEFRDEPGKAFAHFQKGLESSPACTGCWQGLQQNASRMMSPAEVEATLLETCAEVETPGVRGGRAVALLGADRLDAGLAELQRAIVENPARPEFRLWLARALYVRHRWEEALEPLEEALRLRPEWPNAIVLRGLCRFHLEDHSGACDDWAKAESAAPAEMEIVSHCDRGLSHSIIGLYEQAIEHFDRGLALESGSEIVYNRVVARAELVGRDGAADEIEAAMEVVDADERPLVRHYGRGGLMALLGETDEACLELERACAVDAQAAGGWAKNDPAWNGVRNSTDFRRATSVVVAGVDDA